MAPAAERRGGGVLNAPRWGARRILGLVFVVAAFAFLALFVSRDVERLTSYPWTVRPLLLAASLLLNVGALLWGVWAWKILLRMLGFRVRLVELARIWFVSGLGRYIPGKIWQFVGAAHLGQGVGLPATVTVTSLAAHTFFFLLAAVLTAALLVPAGGGVLAADALAAIRLAAPLLLLLVHPAVIRRVLRLMGRATGREVGEWSGGWAGAIGIVGLGVVGWVIAGSALFLFVRSLVPLDAGAAPATIGINALAFVAGYLVFVAPAGLGAKEGALAALLSVYLPLSVAALVAVAARIWTIGAEVLPALLLLRTRSPETGADRADPPRDP